MKFKFASFAALSLSAVEAARLQQKLTSEHLVKNEKAPQSYTNIMESVKSLEKAFEYHKNEEKLLNDINNELKDYWNLQEQTRSETSEEPQLIATKAKESTKAKEKAKAEHKEKEKEKAAAAESAQQETAAKKAPADTLNTEVDENLQLDDNNFLQLSAQTDETPSDLSLQSIMNSNPDLFQKELQQLRQSSKMESRMRNSNKQKTKSKQSQKAAQKSAVKLENTHKNSQKITAENEQAEKEWTQELAAFKAIQQKKVDGKRRNEELVKMEESSSQSLKEEQLANQTEKAMQEAKLDINLKIQAAEEAAEQAENLVKEAEDEAQDLINDLNQVSEDQQEDKNQPLGYRFIEIPEFAFTSDPYQEDALTQVSSSTNEDSEWNIDWNKAKSVAAEGLRRGKAAVEAAKNA